MSLVLTWIANSLAIYAVAYLMRSVDVASLLDAFLAGGVLTLINAIVKPVLVILTLPLTIVTLGIFYFFVSAFCLWLASKLVGGFMLSGVLSTVVAAILISLISTILTKAFTRAARDR
jgi:putative membrane protein